ncbi:MAG TPA: hypothetical protein VFS20_30690 [Longimicrobium sp.]|nr:hypothetical protein [Longimicrobium sp.]
MRRDVLSREPVEWDRPHDGDDPWSCLRRGRAMERSNYPLIPSVDDLGDGFCLTTQVNAGVGAHEHGAGRTGRCTGDGAEEAGWHTSR